MVRAVTPIPFVKARFFDRCGKPLAGGKVYTYEANTTTPKVTYKDPYGLTPNTNPIILDAAGEADIYLDGTYRIRITDRNDVLVNDVEKIGSWFSDNLQDTLDNISGAMGDALKPILQNLDNAINTAAAAGAGANGWTDTLIAVSENINQRQINDGLTNVSQLASIKNPRNGMRVFVNSYYDGLGVGGDYFYFEKNSSETLVQGLVVAGQGGVWKRGAKPFYLVEDFGVHKTKDAVTNSAALAVAFANVKNIVATQSYNVNLSEIEILSGTVLSGGGSFIGPDADLLQASASGSVFAMHDESNIVINDITVKNGYAGKGFYLTNSHNIEFNNVTADGFTYGIWIAENGSKKGCSNIRINGGNIKNTRYWGIYIRCLDVINDADKTQNIVCSGTHFYNAHGAGFVVSEGDSRYITLENPFFNRCSVAMHFEGCSNYKIVNPTTIDTGKKSDHLTSPEYPFKDISIYQIFVKNVEIIGGKCDEKVYIGATAISKSWHHKYSGLTCKLFGFEGVEATVDSNKDFFKDFTFEGCTSTEVFFYCENSASKPYLRDFTINKCVCLIGENGGSVNATNVAINSKYTINFKVLDSNFKNSSLDITCAGTLIVKGNTFNKTDNRAIALKGESYTLGSGTFLEFAGNIIELGGGTASDCACYLSNWSRVRTDNVIVVNSVPYGYKFENNYAIEYGAGLVYNETSSKYKETNTTAMKFLYR